MRPAFGETFEIPEGYLNTASIGIPPAGAAEAVLEAVRRWQRGLDDAPDFDPAVATARRAFAQLVGVPADRIASGTSVSATSASWPALSRTVLGSWCPGRSSPA